MDTVEKQALATRTRQRNASTRFAFLYGGVMAPLEDLEESLDVLATPGIENHMAISDEAWGIKESHRDQTIELSQAEVDQDVYLADQKAATGRAKIAIERAADEYTLAARVYDAKVKGLIMAAKEYAALVEVEQLANEEAKVNLAIDKEALHLLEVQTKTYLQTIEQAQVEADIAKAKVDVAKAHVRAALAGIEAGEAEIKLIAAQTEVYVAEADKATLQADVANIYADVLVKGLTETKYQVSKEELTRGFAYIQSHLDDMLSLWDTREAINTIQIESGADLEAEIGLKLLVDKVQEDLRETEIDNARDVFVYEQERTNINLGQERSLQSDLTAAKIALMETKLELAMKRNDVETDYQVRAYKAQAKVSASREVTRLSNNADFTTMSIS